MIKHFTGILIFLSIINSQVISKDNSHLQNYDVYKKDAVQFVLPQKLAEVSGLTFTDDGSLFCHNDEKGAVHQINYNTGEIVKTFYLGNWTVAADFEGIAYSNGKFYLITSSGKLYEFKEGNDGEKVEYEVYDTGASAKFDIEGLCYDPETNSLLFACKEYPGKNFKDKRAVYSYSLETHVTNINPRFLIDLDDLKDDYKIKEFYPSGIERHPTGDSFFVISAKGEKAIVEISKEGEIVDAENLEKDLHRQPEGITFDPNGVLIIADEASGKKPALTKYFPKKYYEELNGQ